MASIVVKPKERQFQVVPVPAVFTRGRWECIDYKDNGIGSGGPPRDFSESQTIEFDKSSSSTTQSTVATLAPTVAQQQTNVVHTVGAAGVQAVQPSVANATPIPSVGISHLTSKPETSLPPSSISISAIPSQVSGTILNKQQESIASTQVTFSSGANQNSQQSTPIAETAPPIGLQTPIPPHQSSVVGAQSSAYQQQHGGIPANSSVPHFEISPTHSVPATLGSEFVPPPGVSSVESNISTSNALGAAANGGTSLPCGIAPPTVAIDNKIEQAMDLVKTHLTFAVREEVEILRSTIADLETRVTYLEGENALLRQFAPADVMANLATLVQQQVVALQAQRAANTSAQQQTKMSMQSVPSAPVIMDQSVAPQGSGNGGSAEEQQN